MNQDLRANQDWEPASMPARLAQLGFSGRRYHGVECFIPPTVPVAGGPFMMGSDKAHDPQAHDNEIPQFQIHVDAFEMATYPVTVAEYALYLSANPGVDPPPDFTYPSDGAWVASAWRGKTLTWAIQQQQRFDHPVVMVSWFKARDYVAWLARLTGQPWRMPSEAEWEKAARGLDGRIYPWGNTWDAKRANTQDGGPQMTTPVGAYASQQDASPYGCHDMAGNVWEWCSSRYLAYPYDVTTSETEQHSQHERVLRGGSWRSEPEGTRMACRRRFPPHLSLVKRGFRLARAG